MPQRCRVRWAIKTGQCQKRRLVEDAAEQLSYRVNPMARALQTGRTGMVGLIVTDLADPSYFDIIRGAQSEAATRGLTLVLAESSDSSAETTSAWLASTTSSGRTSPHRH